MVISGKGPLRRALSARPRRRSAAVVVAALLGLAACGGPDEDTGPDPTAATTTTAPASTSTGPTSTTGDTTSTSGGPSPTGGTFEGAVTPTSAPAPPGTEVALLSAVRVAGQPGFDRVVFEFADAQVPGYDVRYLDGPARQDGSGDEVDVAGGARLEVRMAPASGVDLRRGTFEETYPGPGRVAGDTDVVTEVVRTGDFEANLTWVIGLDREVPYRVEVLGGPARVVLDLATG